jgi:parallel beta-helix repeat protein
VCTTEHQNGILRNNIIVNCPLDVGIYLNKATNTRLYNNTLFNTKGIDVRFQASTADVRNNVLDGKIRNRDGGTSTLGSNQAESDLSAWFTAPASLDFTLINGSTLVDQGEALVEVEEDFCTNARDDGAPDIGAVEYDGDPSCITTTPYVPLAEPPVSDPEPEAPADVPAWAEEPPESRPAADVPEPPNRAEHEDIVPPEAPPDTPLDPDTGRGMEAGGTTSTAPTSGARSPGGDGGCQPCTGSFPRWPTWALFLMALGWLLRFRRCGSRIPG